jgi:hypothetical protein
MPYLVESMCAPEKQKKERATNDNYKYNDNFHLCAENFLVNAFFQVENNVPFILIQRTYEWKFIDPITKCTVRLFTFKLSTKLNTAFP